MKNNSNEFDGLTKESLVSNRSVRVGWGMDAKAIATDESDDLLLSDFSNFDDQKLEW